MDNIVMYMSEMYPECGFCPQDALLLDLRGLRGTDSLCDREAARAIRDALRELPAAGTHWIDGGNWHYLTLMWMEKVSEPFTLVLLDNHSDDRDTMFGDILSCGNWVLEARRSLPMMVSDVRNRAPERTGPVYISIDLDVLSRREFCANWDQGDMSLRQMSRLVMDISRSHRVIGIDICGGKSFSQGATWRERELNARCYRRVEKMLDKAFGRERICE